MEGAEPSLDPRKERAFKAFAAVLLEESESADRLAKTALSAVQGEGTTMGRDDTAESTGEHRHEFAAHTVRAGKHRRILAELDRVRKRLASVESDGAIDVGSLVNLHDQRTGDQVGFFVVPDGAGKKFKVGDAQYTTITLHSPLGGALYGSKVGDTVRFEQTGTRLKVFKVLSVE